MPEILELPELRKRVSKWSVDEYENLVERGLAPKRGELIRGIIVDKMSKSPLHADLTEFIYESFLQQIPEGHSVFSERPLRFIDSEPEPDVSVAKGTRVDFQRSHPTTALLVVEVAVSSVAGDREYAAMYAEAGVPEYWIILAEAKQVEVYRLPQDGVYRQKRNYSLGEVVNCHSLPSLNIPLLELFG